MPEDWGLRIFIFKPICIKEIDGKQYLGIEESRMIRGQRTIVYYEEYNWFAYRKTEYNIEEYYEKDRNDKEYPTYRIYHKIPETDSEIFYYDENGKVVASGTFNENGKVIIEKDLSLKKDKRQIVPKEPILWRDDTERNRRIRKEARKYFLASFLVKLN